MKKRFVVVFSSLNALNEVGRDAAVEMDDLFLVTVDTRCIQETSVLWEKAHSIFPAKGRALKSRDGSVCRTHLKNAPVMRTIDVDFFCIMK